MDSLPRMGSFGRCPFNLIYNICHLVWHFLRVRGKEENFWFRKADLLNGRPFACGLEARSRRGNISYVSISGRWPFGQERDHTRSSPGKQSLTQSR